MSLYEIYVLCLLVLIAFCGTAVVLTRQVRMQIVVAGVFGLFEAVLFFALHSPDVGLSQLTVSTVAMPFLLLLTLSRLEGKPE